MGIFYRCPECNSNDFEMRETERHESYPDKRIVNMLAEVMQCQDCGYVWEEMYTHSYARDETGQILTP